MNMTNAASWQCNMVQYVLISAFVVVFYNLKNMTIIFMNVINVMSTHWSYCSCFKQLLALM